MLLCALLLQGCAALMNSNRPAYHGRIAQPVWHNASMQVEQQPLIYDGMVYAVGRPFEGRNWPRVYAFDARTGQVKWETTFSAKAILLPVEQTLYVADQGSRVHSLNAKTGEEFAPPDAIDFATAAYGGEMLYSAGGSILSARTRAMLPVGEVTVDRRPKPVWRAYPEIEKQMVPVVGGANVYTFGLTPSDFLTKKRSLVGVYAYDRRNGELRWKWEKQDKTDAFLVYGVAADESSAYLWMIDKTQSLLGKGILLALDAATGNEKWRHTTSMFVYFPTTPLLLKSGEIVIADYPTGDVKVADEVGWVYRALNRETGTVAWESRTPWKYRNLAYADGMLLASDQKVHEVFNENNQHSPDSWVSAVDLRSGQERWRSETMELGILTTPAASDGLVVVGSKPFTWSDPKREGKPEVSGLWAWRM